MGILNRRKNDTKEDLQQVAKGQEKKASVKKSAAKKSADSKGAKKAVKMLSKTATSTVLGPVVSEKSAQLSDSNVLVFKVNKSANRVEIRNAFRELYGVTPVRINTTNVRGKRVRFGRVFGKRSDWKKAFIYLPEGVNVDIFEGV